jgi:hypothetical protein
MKKIALIAMVAIAGTSMVFTSCSKKKDWTCKCTVLGTPANTPILDSKKSVAEESCDAIENQGNALMGAGSFSCDLTEN